MSNRSLIEFNHDFTGDLGFEFINELRRYMASSSRTTAERLERYGVRVLGMRHHSGNFILDGTPDGFPVQHLERSEET